VRDQNVPTGDPAVFTRLGGQLVEEPAPFSRYAGRPPDRPESKALVKDLILLGKLHDGRLLHPTDSSSLAEYERELIKERTALKRQASRANGTKFGRPRRVEDPVHIATAKRMKADGHTSKDIARYLGVSRATLYRYLADDAAA
jgi:Helix-turn-helix domain of resolvase